MTAPPPPPEQEPQSGDHIRKQWTRIVSIKEESASGDPSENPTLVSVPPTEPVHDTQGTHIVSIKPETGSEPDTQTINRRTRVLSIQPETAASDPAGAPTASSPDAEPAPDDPITKRRTRTISIKLESTPEDHVTRIVSSERIARSKTRLYADPIPRLPWTLEQLVCGWPFLQLLLVRTAISEDAGVLLMRPEFWIGFVIVGAMGYVANYMILYSKRLERGSKIGLMAVVAVAVLMFWGMIELLVHVFLQYDHT